MHQIKNLKDVIGLTIESAIPITNAGNSIKLSFSNGPFVIFTAKDNYTEWPDVVVDAKEKNETA